MISTIPARVTGGYGHERGLELVLGGAGPRWLAIMITVAAMLTGQLSTPFSATRNQQETRLTATKIIPY